MTEVHPAHRVAVDTGGTFTDVAVRRPDGSIAVTKVSSDPEAPEEAVMRGVTESLSAVGVGPGEVSRFVHGTTVATNALITRTGATVGLVTTRGFADMLRIGHQTRASLYDARARRPDALVPPELTWEIDERLAADGSVLATADEAAVNDLAARIRRSAPEVVVVSLLNAYADPSTEQRLADLLAAARAAPAVTAATSVVPEIREYERTSTAVVNAYVGPRVSGYVDRLERRLDDLGVPARLWVMQSNGGVLSAAGVRRRSAATVLSGLAGGVVGAARWASRLGLSSVVSLDIGGTSTDIALIRDGTPDETAAGEIEGYPLRIPAIDVHTIGAGGGSVAWRDAGGSLRVGPHSAGAHPGPISYGRGGTEVTVTDAHAALGRLGETLLDGVLPLDLPAARTGVERVAGELGLRPEHTAAGVLRVVNATMARGIRAVSVERGTDLRDCVLMAFGGAGPLHAADLVEELGMRGAVVPPHPGIASALGMLDAPLRHDASAAVTATDDDGMMAVDRELRRLEVQSRELLADAERLDPASVRVDRALDARYRGQSHELTIPWRPDIEGVRKEFDAAHLARHGFADPQAEIEIVAARISAGVLEARTELAESAPGPGAALEPVARRPVCFAGHWHTSPVYRRSALPTDVVLTGPAVLEQLDSTVVIGPHQRLHQDRYGFAHIHAASRTPEELQP